MQLQTLYIYVYLYTPGPAPFYGKRRQPMKAIDQSHRRTLHAVFTSSPSNRHGRHDNAAARVRKTRRVAMATTVSHPIR